MKEKLKDVISVILILLAIGMWCTIGFNWPKCYLAIEVICGCFLMAIVSLMHRK